MKRKAMAIGDGERTCIYCRRDSSTSVSIPHVYPECIARNNATLPIGVECDDCNSRAGKLDQAVCSHQRIGKIGFVRGVPGKDGHIRRRHGLMTRDAATGNIVVEGVSKVLSFNDNTLEIAAPAEPQLDDERFRRGLYHIGLNHLALVAGSRVALEPRYDAVRNYVRYNRPRRAWQYAQVPHDEGDVRGQLGCRYLRTGAGTVVRIMTFCDDFYVNLEGDGQLGAWARRWLPSTNGVL